MCCCYPPTSIAIPRWNVFLLYPHFHPYPQVKCVVVISLMINCWLCVCVAVPAAVPLAARVTRNSPGAARLFLLRPAGASLCCLLPGERAEGRQAGTVSPAACTGKTPLLLVWFQHTFCTSPSAVFFQHIFLHHSFLNSPFFFSSGHSSVVFLWQSFLSNLSLACLSPAVFLEQSLQFFFFSSLSSACLSVGFFAELQALPLFHKPSIWLPCGTVLTGGMYSDLTTMWYCVDCGMYNVLIAMWYYVDWWNVQWSDCHVVLCWLVECTVIWLPCGTVLTGGMHNDLTAMWYCVDWWNALWLESDSAFRWLWLASSDCSRWLLSSLNGRLGRLSWDDPMQVTGHWNPVPNFFEGFVWNRPVFCSVAMP